MSTITGKKSEINLIFKNMNESQKNHCTISLCNLYRSLRYEMNTRLSLNFGLITVTATILASVTGFMAYTQIYDFGLVGCFSLIGLQFIYLEYSGRIRDLSYYLFNIEEYLEKCGVILPEGGWHHHLLAVYSEGTFTDQTKEKTFYKILRLKLHYVGIGLMILNAVAFTFFNYLAFYAYTDTYFFLNHIPKHWYPELFWVIEIIGLAAIAVFVYLCFKARMELTMVEEDESCQDKKSKDDEAIRLLRIRYAKSEISEREYKEKKKNLSE